MSLSYAVDTTSDADVAIMSLAGSVDHDAAITLEEAFDTVFCGNAAVIVDLSGVKYISSSGWRTFILRMREFRDNRERLKIAGMRSTVREVFELLGFTQIIDAYATANEALTEFKRNQRQDVAS